jgi:hypothetical protein
MRAVVLSDTHIPHRSSTLPDEVWREIENSDLVIHAGDFTTYDFYLELKAHNSNLYAVHGNMDEPDLVRILPEKKIFEVEGKRIGVIHGFGAPFGLEKKVRRRFEGESLDLLIFGHSHRALYREEEGILLLNPGSPTDRIFTTRRSYGILEINGGKIEGRIVYLP